MAFIKQFDIIDSSEVCHICKFGNVHLNRIVQEGKIPARRIGRCWVFSRRDVIKFQREREKKAKTDRRIKLKK